MTDKNSMFLKAPLEILQIAYAAEILQQGLHQLPLMLPVGIKETDIEVSIVNYLRKHDCQPASKGYKGFLSDISISRNHIVTHGVPSEVLLQKNDVLTVDVICKYKQWYADMSWTYGVESLSDEHKHLLNIAWKISRAGIMNMKVGNTLRDVAIAIQNKARFHKVFVYNQFIGHGIGKEIHELPHVRYDRRVEPIPIVSGMVLCIEPIVSLKSQRVIQLSNGAYIGNKKHATAVYEHMVAIFNTGPRILSYGMIHPEQLPESHPQFT